jgi:hypothetical protein
MEAENGEKKERVRKEKWGKSGEKPKFSCKI